MDKKLLKQIMLSEITQIIKSCAFCTCKTTDRLKRRVETIARSQINRLGYKLQIVNSNTGIHLVSSHNSTKFVAIEKCVDIKRGLGNGTYKNACKHAFELAVLVVESTLEKYKTKRSNKMATEKLKEFKINGTIKNRINDGKTEAHVFITVYPDGLRFSGNWTIDDAFRPYEKLKELVHFSFYEWGKFSRTFIPDNKEDFNDIENYLKELNSAT